jgi:hypothetical protein
MTDYLLENGIKSLLFWAVGLVALWIVGMAFSPALSPQSSFPSVAAGKWQAVFLSNNQVYFGKLANESASYVTLSDVYYLRTAGDLDNQSASNLNLIKLGGEVHGPENTIYIPKSSILFFENMKDNSRVVQTIISTKQ